MSKRIPLEQQLADLQAAAKRLKQFEKVFNQMLQVRFNATSKEIDDALKYYNKHKQNPLE